MVASMAPNPIIFAMANPEPEITPDEVAEVRDDAIVATGRSDYHNQINNVMCFPYMFRGALDVRASTINDEMKIAAAEAIAALARSETPDESVERAYGGFRPRYGTNYIVPLPFDQRLMREVPAAVAMAAIKTGVAQNPITDIEAYKRSLAARVNPAANMLYLFFDRVMESPRRVVFAEGEEEAVVKAALQWTNQGCGTAILVGHEDVIRERFADLGVNELGKDIIITNAALSPDVDTYIDDLYKDLQRQGHMVRDCARLVKHNRHVFAAELLKHGQADALVTGVTSDYLITIQHISKVIGLKQPELLFSLSMLLKRDKVLFIADTAINEMPNARQLVDIALQSVTEVRNIGYEQKPRVAFISPSNFGNPPLQKATEIKEAIKIMDSLAQVDFEYDGEMTVEAALNPEVMKLYPFCRLSGPANILVMPSLYSASISAKLLQEFGKAISIGPILSGFDKSVQVVPIGAESTEIFNAAAIAAARSLRLTN